METTKEERAGVLGEVPIHTVEARLCRDVDTVVEALEEWLEHIDAWPVHAEGKRCEWCVQAEDKARAVLGSDGPKE